MEIKRVFDILERLTTYAPKKDILNAKENKQWVSYSVDDLINNSKNTIMWEELNEIKTHPISGKNYDAIRKVKCNCECHDPKNMVMHFMPCCDNGLITEYRECK